jgi:hypothetical protein
MKTDLNRQETKSNANLMQENHEDEYLVFQIFYFEDLHKQGVNALYLAKGTHLHLDCTGTGVAVATAAIIGA